MGENRINECRNNYFYIWGSYVFIFYLQMKEIKRCKMCGKVISNKRGKPNKSGLCSNCFNTLREMNKLKNGTNKKRTL